MNNGKKYIKTAKILNQEIEVNKKKSEPRDWKLPDFLPLDFWYVSLELYSESIRETVLFLVCFFTNAI